MGFMGRKSKLSSKTISKVWLNKKDYKFQDFDFKVVQIKNSSYGNYSSFFIEVFNCGELILRLGVEEKGDYYKPTERFEFHVMYFNPQTDNDCFSINHIIAVSSEFSDSRKNHQDKGNADVIRNQFIYRKRDSFYTFVKVWSRGEITSENYDKQLSYELATDEYINYIKRIFKLKKIPRRKIKDNFKGFMDKFLIVTKLTDDNYNDN